jgi:hypothetical protein
MVKKLLGAMYESKVPYSADKYAMYCFVAKVTPDC